MIVVCDDSSEEALNVEKSRCTTIDVFRRRESVRCWYVLLGRYGFGWESQLLETAFLAVFAVPLFSMRPFAPACPPPAVVPWLYRWLGFRIMLGKA